MDTERDPQNLYSLQEPRPPQDRRPAKSGLLPATEPDAEVATAYAAWRLERAEERR